MSIIKKEEQIQLITDAPRYSSLDTTHLNDLSYSVRVPDFIKAGWDKLTQTTQIGEVTIEHYGPGTKPKIIVKLNSNAPYEVPFEHFPENFEIKLDPQTSMNNQYLFTSAPDSGYVKIAGQIMNSGHLTSEDVEKMTFCREYVEKQEAQEKKEKKKKGKTIIDSHAKGPLVSSKSKVLQKREFKDRTSRMSEEQLQSELFHLFNSNPEWSVQDLAKRLSQSAQDITKVLRSIAVYDEKTKTYHLNANYNFDN